MSKIGVQGPTGTAGDLIRQNTGWSWTRPGKIEAGQDRPLVGGLA